MFIDTHAHVYPPLLRRDREKIAEKEPYFELLTGSPVHRWGDADELIAAMDATGVDQSWISGFAFRDPALCALCNDYVIDAVRRWPGRLRGFAVVNPARAGFMAEIERCASLGLTGVGELFPDGQGFRLDDQSQTWRLAAACADMNMPLRVHTAEPVGHAYAGKGSAGPREAAAFCAHHPENDVIFAHFGGGLWLYETMPELRLYLRRARYDTAAWPFLYDASAAAAARAAGVADKMLYGSDWPILSRKRYQTRLDAYAAGGGLEALTGGNARRFLEDIEARKARRK